MCEKNNEKYFSFRVSHVFHGVLDDLHDMERNGRGDGINGLLRYIIDVVHMAQLLDHLARDQHRQTVPKIDSGIRIGGVHP